MDWKKIVLGGILFTIISEVIHTLEAFLTMKYYLMPDYFAVWSKVMMPTAGPPPMSFYYYSIAFTLIVGLVFAAAYSILQRGIPAKGFGKGIHFGVLLYMISGVPFTTTTFLLVNLPLGLLVVWNISTFIIYLISGKIFEKVMG